jgi:hypothetical protein
MLAALCALTAGEYLGNHHYYSMNALDHLFWAASAWLILRALATDSRRHWAALGVVLGLGLLNKLSLLWLAGGLVLGTLASPRRRILLRPGPWLAAGIAAALFLPHLLWQISQGWPVREFIHNATTIKMTRYEPGDFLLQQLLNMNPAAAPVWIAGLLWGLLSSRGRRWIVLPLAYLTVLAILLANAASRAGYLAPAYAMLFPLGAVAIESWTRSGPRWVLRPLLALHVLVGGFVTFPFAVPSLPPDLFVRYAAWIGIGPRQEERSELAELPQHYADQFGWEEMVDTVARVHRSLPPEEQQRCVVFGQNYGEAGAIDALGRRLGLPRAVSGHNSYWLWGPGDWDGSVMIILGSNQEDNEEFFEQVEQVATIPCDRCMPYERDLPVFVGRRLKMPVAEAWPRLKMYI